jgi:hypothetical protein
MGAPWALLSVRSALVLTVSVLAALSGAALMYAARRPAALVVLGAAGIFAGALKLLDSLIELAAGDPGRHNPADDATAAWPISPHRLPGAPGGHRPAARPDRGRAEHPPAPGS